MPHIFISYQRDDTDFAELLKRELNHAGFTSWIDAERLRAGKSWRAAIDTAIQEAEALIVIMTPSAKKSEYVTYEWAFALGAGKPVIPLLRKSTPLHPRLEDLQYLDFSNNVSQPWDQLVARLEQVGKQSAAISKVTQPTSTIQSSDNTSSHTQPVIAAPDSVRTNQRHEDVETLEQTLSPEALKIFVAALEHPSKDIRVSVIKALTRNDDTNAVPALLDLLHVEDETMRVEVIKVLKQIGDARAVPALLDLLTDEDPLIPWVVVDTLKQIGDTRAVPALLDLLKINNWDMQVAVTNTLLRIGDVNAIITALDLIKDADIPTGFKWSIVDKLEHMGTPEALAVVGEWRKQQPEALTAVEEWRKQQEEATSQ